MHERIYIPELKSLLPYKKLVTIRKWCLNNGVRILCDIGSNKLFVLRSEFESAIRRNNFQSSQKISSTMRVFSELQIIKDEKAKRYKPQGEYEKEFLSILQNLDPTL